MINYFVLKCVCSCCLLGNLKILIILLIYIINIKKIVDSYFIKKVILGVLILFFKKNIEKWRFYDVIIINVDIGIK